MHEIQNETFIHRKHQFDLKKGAEQNNNKSKVCNDYKGTDSHRPAMFRPFLVLTGTVIKM